MKRAKRAFTLLEMMLVIFLIGIVGSVIGYNMKGSLEQGKAFKSEQGSKQVYDILMLEVAKGVSIDDIVNSPRNCLLHSGLAKNADKMLKDGWNQAFVVSKTTGDDLRISSKKFEEYLRKKDYSEEHIEENYWWMINTLDNHS